MAEQKRVKITWIEPAHCEYTSLQVGRFQVSGYLLRHDKDILAFKPDGRLAQNDVYVIPACCVIAIEVLS